MPTTIAPRSSTATTAGMASVAAMIELKMAVKLDSLLECLAGTRRCARSDDAAPMVVEACERKAPH